MKDGSSFESQQNTEVIDRTSIETLGINGEKLAPVIDWEHLPPHISRERFEDFVSYFLHTLHGKVDQITAIISNIRYIDSALTKAALQELAKRITVLSQSENICLITDDEKEGSRWWICDELVKLGGFRRTSENQLNNVTNDTTFVVVDDLMIFGEQSARLMDRVIEKLGKKVKFVEAYLAATNNFRNGFRHNIDEGHRVIRVFDVPDLTRVGIRGQIPLNANLSCVLTFFAHKVSDRFLPMLTRSRSRQEEDGTHHWLVDDLAMAPPYQIDRFTNLKHGWAHMAKKIPQEL